VRWRMFGSFAGNTRRTTRQVCDASPSRLSPSRANPCRRSLACLKPRRLNGQPARQRRHVKTNERTNARRNGETGNGFFFSLSFAPSVLLQVPERSSSSSLVLLREFLSHASTRDEGPGGCRAGGPINAQEASRPGQGDARRLLHADARSLFPRLRREALEAAIQISERRSWVGERQKGRGGMPAWWSKMPMRPVHKWQGSSGESITRRSIHTHSRCSMQRSGSFLRPGDDDPAWSRLYSLHERRMRVAQRGGPEGPEGRGLQAEGRSG